MTSLAWASKLLDEARKQRELVDAERLLPKDFPVNIMLIGNRREVIVYEHGPLTAEIRALKIREEGLRYEDRRHKQIRHFPPSSIEEIYYAS